MLELKQQALTPADKGKRVFSVHPIPAHLQQQAEENGVAILYLLNGLEDSLPDPLAEVTIYDFVDGTNINWEISDELNSSQRKFLQEEVKSSIPAVN